MSLPPGTPSASPGAAPVGPPPPAHADDPGDAGLRAEHEELADRLATRRSIDAARRALYQIFVGLIGVGFTVKLGWDRWGTLKAGVVRKTHAGPPVFLWIATIVTIVLLVLSIRSFLAARRLMREEDALFARYQSLRRRLGVEP